MESAQGISERIEERAGSRLWRSKSTAKATSMMSNSLGRWVTLALILAIIAGAVSPLFRGVPLIAQGEKRQAARSPTQGGPELPVLTFGAVGDGKADDTAAVQKA